MINIPCVNFVIFSTIDILFLVLAGCIIKKYLVAFPNKLIPILNTVASLIITCVWGVASNHDHPLFFCAQVGVIYGLASIGLHQMVKQTVDYFKIRNYMKKELNKKSRIISMSD